MPSPQPSISLAPWRRRLERIEGLAFDIILVAIAAAVSEDFVQQWLLAHTAALFHGLMVLHLVACPAMLVAVLSGYGQVERELMRPGSGPLGWAMALLLSGSFIVPGVLGLIFNASLWEMLLTIFGPQFIVFPAWLGVILIGERRGWLAPARLNERKPWWCVQALTLLTWAYLLWLETMLLAAAARPGPLSQVGVPAGLLLDYLPIRVVLYYVRDSASWERYTIAASIAHFVYRIATA